MRKENVMKSIISGDNFYNLANDLVKYEGLKRYVEKVVVKERTDYNYFTKTLSVKAGEGVNLLVELLYGLELAKQYKFCEQFGSSYKKQLLGVVLNKEILMEIYNNGGLGRMNNKNRSQMFSQLQKLTRIKELCEKNENIDPAVRMARLDALNKCLSLSDVLNTKDVYELDKKRDEVMMSGYEDGFGPVERLYQEIVNLHLHTSQERFLRNLLRESGDMPDSTKRYYGLPLSRTR